MHDPRQHEHAKLTFAVIAAVASVLAIAWWPAPQPPDPLDSPGAGPGLIAER